MRFREIESGTEQNHEQQRRERSKRALPETQNLDEKKKDESSLPLEWRTLRPFIEAAQCAPLTEEQAKGFWQRLHPRLMAAIRHDKAVSEYLRRTFWRRWGLRVAAAAGIIFLLQMALLQQRSIETLRGQVTDLQSQIQTLRAGM
jgi:anti-sigma-K factor RskA